MLGMLTFNGYCGENCKEALLWEKDRESEREIKRKEKNCLKFFPDIGINQKKEIKLLKIF